MKDNVPEEGDIIRFNAEALAELGQWNYRLPNIDKREGCRLRVKQVSPNATSKQVSPNATSGARNVHFSCIDNCHPDDWWPVLYDTGCLCCSLTLKVPLFVLDGQVPRAVQDPQLPDSAYCSCGGPTKPNVALHKPFNICVVCKKESKSTVL